MPLSSELANRIRLCKQPLTNDQWANLQDRARQWRQQGLNVQQAAKLARDGFIADEGLTLSDMQKLLQESNAARSRALAKSNHNWIT